MKAVYPPAQVASYDPSFSGASPPATRRTTPATRAALGSAVTHSMTIATTTPNVQRDGSNCNTTYGTTMAAVTTMPCNVASLHHHNYSFDYLSYISFVTCCKHWKYKLHCSIYSYSYASDGLKALTLNARGNKRSCRDPTPIAVNFPHPQLQVWFFLSRGTGGPKKPQGCPCRTLVL